MPPIKRRYIGFKIDSRNVDSRDDFSSIREGDIVRAVKESIQKLHGDFGTASIIYSLILKRYDRGTRTGIFAIKRETYQFLSSALPIVSQVGKLDVSLSILAVSGTLRGCFKRLQEYHKMMVRHYKKFGTFGQNSETQDSKNKISAHTSESQKGEKDIPQKYNKSSV